MKSVGTIEATIGLWHAPNTDADNSSGFTGLPGGTRNDGGTFYGIGSFSIWWSSTDYDSDNAMGRFLISNEGKIYKPGGSKRYGYSVRCLKD